jgi:predicted RNase H-like HicB family nuclease
MIKYKLTVCWSEKDQAYLVEIPELEGCMADGATYQEAVANAEQVITEWLETTKELGRYIPKPKGCKEIEIITKKFNGWGDSIISTFIPHIQSFRKVFTERILPAFNNLETEAENSYQQYLLECASDDSHSDWDDTKFACMRDVRQSVINLYAVGLRHLYEQQFSYLVMRLLNNYQRQADYKKDEKVLVDTKEVDIKSFRSWKKIEELGYVCNAVKHAEGHSSEKLKKLRLDLFEHPSASVLELPNNINERLLKASKVRQPLAGENIYLQETDIEEYALAIEDFWKEFFEKLVP